MIGIRAGIRAGLVAGSRNGSGVDELGGGVAVIAATKDATSSKYIPQSAAEWTSVMSAASLATGNPSFLWKCQEATGNLADSIGACTLTAANAPSYANAVPGWSTKAVGWADGSTSQFSNTTTPPNGNASSLALLCYQYVSSVPGAAHHSMATMTTFAVAIAANNSGKAEGFDNGIGVGTETITDGVVRPFFMVYNRALTTCKLYTGVDKIDATYAVSAGVATQLGSGGFGSTAGGCLYATQFTGTAAELTDAQVKSLLQTLGWTVSWT